MKIRVMPEKLKQAAAARLRPVSASLVFIDITMSSAKFAMMIRCKIISTCKICLKMERD